jgi:hypothetical protein
MKKEKIFTNIKDMMEHDLLLAFQGWHRLDPNDSIDSKLQKAYDTVSHYIQQDLDYAFLQSKSKITNMLLTILDQ